MSSGDLFTVRDEANPPGGLRFSPDQAPDLLCCILDAREEAAAVRVAAGCVVDVLASSWIALGLEECPVATLRYDSKNARLFGEWEHGDAAAGTWSEAVELCPDHACFFVHDTRRTEVWENDPLAVALVSRRSAPRFVLVPVRPPRLRSRPGADGAAARAVPSPCARASSAVAFATWAGSEVRAAPRAARSRSCRSLPSSSWPDATSSWNSSCNVATARAPNWRSSRGCKWTR